jgi:hypothetical protein
MIATCLYCKKEFNLNRRDKKYCSTKCKHNAKTIRKWGCLISSKEKRNGGNYKLIKEKVKCDICGFIPVNVCQLDIDHIDGNHQNNDLDNLQVLCANCHRLKTFINGDWKF